MSKTLLLLIMAALAFPSGRILDAQQLGVNVEAYGAVADDNTDSTAAIRQAISAMHTGGKLVFPCTAGSAYKVTQPISFGSMVDMAIEGASRACTLDYEGAGGVPYAFSFVGAERLDIEKLRFYAGSNSAPQTVLMLGLAQPNSQSGVFSFRNIRVEGYASRAIVYSIASEENHWEDTTVIINGGGAQYGIYIGYQDSLGVAGLPTSSNLSQWWTHFHVYDFTGSTSVMAIADDFSDDGPGAGDHHFDDGYIATQGTAFDFINYGAAWYYLTRARAYISHVRVEQAGKFLWLDAPNGAGITNVGVTHSTLDTYQGGALFVYTQQPGSFLPDASDFLYNFLNGSPSYGTLGNVRGVFAAEPAGPPGTTGNTNSIIWNVTP